MSPEPGAYRGVLDRLARAAQAKGQPYNGTIELTARCNLACRMCYVRLPANDAAARAAELSAAQWLEVVAQAQAGGMVFLLITGGEPLLRPDFFELWAPLTRRGLMLTLYTNATLVTESVAERLAAAPPSRIGVTLYGATAATYEAVTGQPDGLERCLAGIERLMRRGLPLVVRSTLSTYNVDELEAMRAIAADFGVPFQSSWYLTGRADRQPSEAAACRLSDSCGLDLEAEDRERRGLPAAEGRRTPPPANAEAFYCAAGQASFVLDPSGAMHVCLDLRQPGARPLEVGFEAAWAATRAFVAAHNELGAECAACDVRAWCGRCPASSMIETGTLTEPVPALCELAKLRAARETAGV